MKCFWLEIRSNLSSHRVRARGGKSARIAAEQRVLSSTHAKQQAAPLSQYPATHGDLLLLGKTRRRSSESQGVFRVSGPAAPATGGKREGCKGRRAFRRRASRESLSLLSREKRGGGGGRHRHWGPPPSRSESRPPGQVTAAAAAARRRRRAAGNNRTAQRASAWAPGLSCAAGARARARRWAVRVTGLEHAAAGVTTAMMPLGGFTFPPGGSWSRRRRATRP